MCGITGLPYIAHDTVYDYPMYDEISYTSQDVFLSLFITQESYELCKEINLELMMIVLFLILSTYSVL